STGRLLLFCKMNDLENLNKFGSNEDNQIEFSGEDEIGSNEDDEVESIDDNKTESNKENEEKFETKTCEMLGQIYPTKKDILNAVQEIARHSGFAVTIKSSSQRHFHLQCKCDSKWQIVKVINKHNHPKVKDARVFHEHCRLIQEAKRIAVQMLNVGAKPSTIYEAIRDENREPTATRQDILNLSSRIHISEENVSIEVLIVGMEKRGYSIHRENHE
ncbi:12015_t:CDS:2, partial [Racocetra persica]